MRLANEDKMSIVLNRIRKKTQENVENTYVNHQPAPEPPVMIKCPACGKKLNRDYVAKKKYICYECGYYFRVRANNRIKMVIDRNSFESWYDDIETENPLDFPQYEEKIQTTQEKTGLVEGVVVGRGKIYGKETVIGVIDSRFLMGSMGHVVGEKIALAVEKATQLKLPVVLFCCSGGARMQEGIVSLMQMAKTSAAIRKHSDAGLLYVPVLTDPTTGGVTASFAMLGDIILAEPGALIGFAGARVIEQTIGEKLPEGFQRAEFQLKHGFVDAIVERRDLKKTLYRILKLHEPRQGYVNFDPLRQDDEYGPTELMKERQSKSTPLEAWEKVKAARHVNRLGAMDYIEAIFDDFIELHGDRYFRDDPAIIGGIACLDGQQVTIIGVNRGKDIKDCMVHNFGMPSPEGYRKALRLMKQAEKFNRPIITFVNTSGAYPGMEAEANGQGEAIARNLFEMAGMKVPILCLMIGEGGSGGALALAVGNEVWMMENATYCVLSPEGFASILWKDSKRAKEAAEVMKITAEDLKELQIIEDVIPEYGGADQSALSSIASYMKGNMKEFLMRQDGKSGEQLAKERYARFRKF